MTDNVPVTVLPAPVDISGVTVPGKVYDGQKAVYTGTPVSARKDTGDVVTVEKYTYTWKRGGNALPDPGDPPKDAGAYTLEIATDVQNYAGTIELPVTIAKRPLTVAVIGKTVQVKAGASAPDLTSPVKGQDYTVTGLAGGDSVSVALSYKTTPDMTAAGRTTIHAEVTGAGDNYALKVADAELIVTAVPPKKYTVYFNSNGGSAVEPQKDVAENTKLTRPEDPTRTGYTFIGWYQNSACTTSWDFANGLVTANATLYARWAQSTASISGSITMGGDFVPGATVRVVQGTVEFARTVTGSDGKYFIPGVPIPGTYNVVAEKDGVTKTILVVLTDQDATNQNITMPEGKVNSLLEIKG